MLKRFMRKHGLAMIGISLMLLSCAGGFVAGYMESLDRNKQTPSETAEKTAQETEIEEEPALVDLGVFELTAYCPCVKCCGKNDGITATGTHATAGRTVAVDPTVIPYGTKVFINGKTYTAEDTGGAIKGNKLDICVSAHEEALNFGVQYAVVYIAP